MCVDGAADMGKSSARTHGQGECFKYNRSETPVLKVILAYLPTDTAFAECYNR